MKQALHIFRKDVRYLRWDLALLLVAIALFAWSEAAGYRNATVNIMVQVINPASQLVLVIMVLLVTTQLVHSERLPGDKQFWLTRPYSWKSLLGAKCLVLLVFVILPMTLSDAVLVSASGFQVSQYLPGLVWEQILRGMVVLAPLLALAAVTWNTTSQIFSLLVLAVVGAISFVLQYDPARFVGSLGWIYSSVATGFVFLCTASIVLLQYARRRTFAARIVFACAVVLANLIPWLPSSMALAIQTRRFQSAMGPSAIHVALHPPIQLERLPSSASVRLLLPLRVTGIPEGSAIVADQVRCRIDYRTPDGEAGEWTVEEWMQPAWVTNDNSHGLFSATLRPAPFASPKGVRLRLRASALVTLGGNRVTVPILVHSHRVAVPGLGSCAEHSPSLYNCQSPFRQSGLIASKGGQAHLLSYSPFPAELALDPIQSTGDFSVYDPPIFEEPVAHFPYEFELDDILLGDYTGSTSGGVQGGPQ